MTSVLDNFLNLWRYLAFPSVGLAFIGAFLLLYVKWSESKDKRLLRKGLILISQAFIYAIINLSLSGIIKFQARNEIANFLNKKNLSITLNNEFIDTDRQLLILKELKNIEAGMAHHSHPLQNNSELKLIAGSDSIILNFYKDSQIKTEYWVFFNKYKNANVGTLTTSIFQK